MPVCGMGWLDSLWCQVSCCSNMFFSVLGCDMFCSRCHNTTPSLSLLTLKQVLNQFIGSQGVGQARGQLQSAIAKSHGSHTARWLTETASVCLKHGLKATGSGLQLGPVKCTLVADHLKTVCPEVHDVVAKLQTPTGVKYFRLMGTGHMPSAVLLRLYDIIINPSRATGISSLLQSIRVVDNQEALAAAAQQTQPSTAHLQLLLPDNLDPTPKAIGGSSAKQAFATSSVSSPALLWTSRLCCTPFAHIVSC